MKLTLKCFMIILLGVFMPSGLGVCGEANADWGKANLVKGDMVAMYQKFSNGTVVFRGKITCIDENFIEIQSNEYVKGDEEKFKEWLWHVEARYEGKTVFMELEKRHIAGIKVVRRGIIEWAYKASGYHSDIPGKVYNDCFT